MSNLKNIISQPQPGVNQTPLNHPLLKNVICPRCEGDNIRLIGDQAVCDDCHHAVPAPLDLLKRQQGDKMLPGFEGV